VTCVAIIPARGGSTRVPLKNIRLFHGHPIIEYSIKAAQDSGLFQRVFVSTDHPGISSVAYKAGADVLWRPDHLAKDNVGTQAVMADALNTIIRDCITVHLPKYACCIYATAPLMTANDLILGYAHLRFRAHPYCYTVGPNWQDAGQWYWGTTRAFLDGVSLDQASFCPLPAERVCDINTEDDWARAEQLYANLIGSEHA
jgi:N-acylneuraminate cytidylyltransferase